eukprot:m.63982 g.63982  ORF g.63982 m.63982 type:complete len:341 (-) comp13472_c0_seq1:92-1114(-)
MAQPADITQNTMEKFFFLSVWVCVIISKVAFASTLLCKGEVEIDGFGMTDVENTVWLRWEAGVHHALNASVMLCQQACGIWSHNITVSLVVFSNTMETCRSTLESHGLVVLLLVFLFLFLRRIGVSRLLCRLCLLGLLGILFCLGTKQRLNLSVKCVLHSLRISPRLTLSHGSHKFSGREAVALSKNFVLVLFNNSRDRILNVLLSDNDANTASFVEPSKIPTAAAEKGQGSVKLRLHCNVIVLDRVEGNVDVLFCHVFALGQRRSQRKQQRGMRCRHFFSAILVQELQESVACDFVLFDFDGLGVAEAEALQLIECLCHRSGRKAKCNKPLGRYRARAD